jgi:hypothetical protein
VPNAVATLAVPIRIFSIDVRPKKLMPGVSVKVYVCEREKERERERERECVCVFVPSLYCVAVRMHVHTCGTCVPAHIFMHAYNRVCLHISACMHTICMNVCAHLCAVRTRSNEGKHNIFCKYSPLSIYITYLTNGLMACEY